MSLRLKAKDGDSPARRQRCYLCKKQINSTFIKEFNRMWHQECLQRFKHRSPRDGDGNTIASPAQTGSLRRNKKRAANEGSDDEGSAEEGSPGKVEHVLPKPLSEQLKDQKGVLKTRKSEAADQQAIVVRRRSSTRTRTLGLPDATRVNKSRLQMSEQKSRQNDQKSRQSDQKSRQNGSEALVTESLHILRNEFARFETKLKHELESVQSSGYRKGQNELKGQISNLQQKITRLKSQRQVMDDKIEDLSRVNKKLDTERKHLCGEDVDELTIEQLDQLINCLKKSLQICHAAKDDKLKKELDRRRNEYSCKVCWSEEATMIVIPCGHLCLCDGCAAKFKVGTPCPLCRTAIQHVMKVYK